MEEHKIAEAAADALKVIDKAKGESLQTIANAAAEAMRVNSVQSSCDHDLLIELKTEMKTKLESLQKSVDNLTNRDDKFALKEDVVWLRNILIISIIGTIFAAVIISFLSKLIK